MYEIRKDGAVLALTESPNYIRLHPDGFYILCEKTEAQGVAVNGVPYALSEGALGACEAVIVVKRDAGHILQEQECDLGKLRYVGGPVKFSQAASVITRRAPYLGEHTEEVLGALGYSPEAISALRSEGAI